MDPKYVGHCIHGHIYQTMSKDVLIPKKYHDALGYDIMNSETGDSMKHWGPREECRKSVCWHVPSKDLIEECVKYSPLVSVGSGYAFTECKIQDAGGDIIATDISPYKGNTWCKDGKAYMKREKLDAEAAIEKYPDRNVFMAWPPYNTDMAYKVAKKMKKGRVLIYVGEGDGGCTGDDQFHTYLYKNFKEIEADSHITSWWGIHDRVMIYRKR